MKTYQYNAKKLSSDCIVDGKINKVDWNALDAVQLIDTVTGEKPRQRTLARFGWTDTHFLAAFHCEDSCIVANLTEHDHSELWTENVVEIFLDPLKLRHIYYELQVNCRNTGFDGVIHLANGSVGVGAKEGMQCFTAWNPTTYQHTVKGKGKFNGSADLDEYWDVELSIAFSELYMIAQAAPRPGDKWLFNTFRVDSGPWGQELYAWSPTMMPNFHVSANFGTMQFVEE